MRKTLFSFGAALVVVAVARYTPTQAANGKVDEILSQMQQAAKAVKTMQARLRYQKENTEIGGKPETDRGVMKFAHVGRNRDKLRIDYEVTGNILAVDGDRITLYQPRISQAILTSRQAMSREREELSFIETPYTSVRELKARFEIVYAGDSQVESAATSRLDLIPRKPSKTKKLSLWVDRSIGLPVRYEITEQGSRVTFTLLEIKTNVDLGRDPFKVNWPPGTKVVRQ